MKKVTFWETQKNLNRVGYQGHFNQKNEWIDNNGEAKFKVDGNSIVIYRKYALPWEERCFEFNKKALKYIDELLFTPPQNRRDSRKFRVHIFPVETCFLNYDFDNQKIYIEDGKELDPYQTIFTESEYNRVRQNFDFLPKFVPSDDRFELVKEGENDD